MGPEGKHTQDGMTIDCTLKGVFENEMKHWEEFRDDNKKDHDELFTGRREHDVRLTKIETKVAFYAASAGTIASLIIYIVERFLK